jgi:hypothetical protein
MAVGDLYEARVEGVCSSGRRWNNVFHLRLEVEVVPTLFDVSTALAEMIQADYVADLLPLLASDHFLTSCRANRVWPTPGIPSVAAVAIAVAGGDPGESCPADVAAVITKRTDQPGKKHIGRTFISGISEAIQVFDQIATAVQPNWQEKVWNFFLGQDLTDTNGNEWKHHVYSATNAKSDPEVLPVSAEIKRVEFDTTLRNMRSRGRRLRNPLTAIQGP